MIDPSITSQVTDMAPSQTNYTPQDARTAARRALGGADVAMQTDFAAIDRRRKPNDIAVKQTVMPATQFNPDEVAKARAIGAQIGMGQDVVLQQMEDAKRQAYMQELDRRRLPQNDPKLAMFLLNPNNAQLAWDDLDALEETKAVEFFGAVPAFESGVQIDLMAREARKIRAKGDAATKADYERLEAIEQRASALYEESGGGLVPGSARLAGQQKEPIKRGLYRGAQAGLLAAGAAAVGGQIGPQAFLPEELVTVPGAAMLFFGIGFTTEMATDTYENLAALSYVDMKRAGIPEQSAQTWSSVAGGIGAGLEFVGMIPVIGQTTSFVGKVIAKEVLDRVVGRGVARAAITAGAQTGLTIGAEMATESAQVVSDAVAMHIAQRVNKMPGILDTPEGRQKVIRDAIEEGVAVGEGMILLAPILPVAGFGADMRNIKRSRRNIEQFERAIKAIERSKLASRDPAAVQQLVDSRTEGKPESDIYVEGAQIDVILRQNEIDPRSLDGLVPGFSERLNEALRTSGTVRFTSGEFLGRLMQSEVGQALRQHVKIGSPKAYSAAELKGKAEEIASNLQRMRDEVGTAGARTQEYIDQVNAIEDEIVAMIEATGKYTPEEARMYATLQLEFIITTADDNKQSPAELWNEIRNVIVVSQTAQQQALAQQQVATLSAEHMAAVERGDMEAAQRMVDEAAEQAMPQSVVRGDGEIGVAEKLLRVFHGSGAFIRQFMYEFTAQGVDQLGSGFYFTTDRVEAVSYTTRRRDADTPKVGGEQQPTVVEAYLDIRNPLRAEQTGSISREQVRRFIAAAPQDSRREGLENWGIDGDTPNAKVLDAYAFANANILRELFKIANDFYGTNTEAFNRAIRDILGYDGVVQDFRVDGVSKKHFVAFFPEQIKSAEAVTRDDQGNVIPLSRRFDVTSPRLFEQQALSQQQIDTLDAQHAAAEQARDVATGERLTKQAAMAAGLTETVYRGDQQPGITEYAPELRTEPGIFTTYTRNVAEEFYAGEEGARKFYVGGRTLDLSWESREAVEWIREWARESGFDFIDSASGEAVDPVDAVMSGRMFDFEGDWSGARWKDIQRTAKAQGYDIVKLKDSGDDIITSVVVLNENNIKLADPFTYDADGKLIPLSKRFNLQSRSVLEQAPVTPQFYSALSKAVGELDAKAMAASGWSQRIKGWVAQGIVKQAEVDWSGLEDWLKMQDGKVSKEAVQEFLQNNGIQVTRVVLGTVEPDPVDIRILADAGLEVRPDPENESQYLLYETTWGNYYAAQDLKDAGYPREVIAAARRFERRPSETKFKQYTLPGGTNYREILLTLPTDLERSSVVKLEDGQWYIRYSNGDLSSPYTTRRFAQKDLDRAIKDMKAGEPTRRGAKYFSTHFPHPNPLLHIRVIDRIDANGRRILFVEEIQSDWGQAGRKRGFIADVAGDVKKKVDALYAQLREVTDQSRALHSRMFDLLQETTETFGFELGAGERVALLGQLVRHENAVAKVQQSSLDEQSKADMLQLLDLNQQARDLSAQIDELVPPQEGEIAIAPFVESTDGWVNLALKQVLLEAVAGNYDAVAFVNGKQSAERYDLSKQVSEVAWNETQQILFAYDANGTAVLAQENVTEKNLADYVGKEVAQKLIEQPYSPGRQRGAEGQKMKRLSGDGLKVGGQGMIAFYDKIVPAAMNKLLKKYGGGKLGAVEIDTRTPESEAWYQELTDADILKQLGFPVTPQLTERVQGGLPLFQEAMEPSEPQGTFDVEKFITTVNAKANISTLAHEGAHWWLEVMGRLSARPNVSPRTKASFDGILRWFGIEGDTADARIAKWNSMTLAEKERHHEAFARNWEIMLYEGKAPSAELQTVFDKFSRWMKRLYISIRDQFNAQYKAKFGVDLPMLSPEVRQFMESLIASDEQIARQKAIRSAMGLFDVRPEGMTDAEWEAYQQMQEEADAESIAEMRARSLKNMKWLRRAERGVLRDMQKETDERRAEVRAEVADSVSQQQVYRARAFLSRGTLVDADGNEQVSENHRLDIDAVRQMYELEPENLRPDLSKLGTGKDGMMGKGGMNPEVAAEMLGYDSADAMIRDLVEAPALEEAIEAETDRVMLERFGDMNTPEQREAAVDSALHGELRSRMNAVELRFLTKVTQPVRILIEAAREVARQIIGEKRLRDIRPREYIAAETRAARDAQEAYQSLPNPETIGKAAYTRSMNEQASAIAAGMAVSDAEAIALQAQQDAIARAEQRNEEYRKKYPQVEPEAVVIAAARKRLLNHELAREALAAQKEVDKGVKYLRNVLSDANRKRMGADAADQVLAILDNYSLVAMTRAQRAKVADLRNWIANAEANGLLIDIDPELADAARRKNYTDMTLTEFRDLVDAVKQIEHVGRNARNIYLAGQKAEFEARRDEINARLTEVAEKKGRKARKELGDEDRKLMNSIASYDASQQTIGNIVYVLDGGERDGPLARYLLLSANEAGNQEAADRAAISEKLDGIIGPLARKGQFAAPKKHFPHINESLSLEQRMVVALNYGNQSNIDRLLNGERWTDEQARVIIESLTEEQLNAVQAIWDVMSSFRSRVAEKSRRLTGREPRWLEPLPLRVNSADGKVVDLRGGYYPAKYNPRRSVGAREVDIAEESDRLQREAYTATTTSRSYEKNRADKPPVDQVLSRQFVAMYSGLNEVIHDLAWHDFAIAATRLLRDREFQRIIKERYGLEVYNAIKDWVDVVVAGDRTKYDAFEKLAILARQNVSVAAMGIRLMTAAIQPTGIFPAMTRVGVRPMVRALAVFAYSPLATSRTVVSRSRFMQSRNRTRFRDLNEVQNIVRDQSLFGKVRRGYIASAYVLTSFMQGIVDTSVWMAAYSNSIKAGKSEQDSVFIADQTVIDTQGSGRVQDLSSAMRGGKKQSAYAKLFTPFYQFSNTMYSLLGAQMRTAPTYGKAAKDLFLILTVGAIIEELIRNALRPSEEEQEPEELIKKLVANQIDFVVGLPFGLREMRGVGSFVAGTDDGMQSYRGPSGLRIVTDATQAATQARQGEFDSAFRRAMINLLGTTTGIPSAQINSTIDGIEAAVEGELEGLDIPRALLFGIKK